MLLLLSPAKTLNFDSTDIKTHTQPQFLEQSEALVNTLKEYSSKEIQDLMGVSEKIADLNVTRYQDFSLPFDQTNAKQAILAFKGDVYQGLAVEEFDEAELNFAHKHIGILSGLYGLLRPLDLMQAYRLEMGTKLDTGKNKNLYQFWGERISHKLNEAIAAQNDNVLINLASNEYFKAVKPKALNAVIYTPVFQDYKNGQYKVISFFAKKARGMMARYILQNQLTDVSQLQKFDSAGYQFSAEKSQGNELVFTRDEQ